MIDMVSTLRSRDKYLSRLALWFRLVFLARGAARQPGHYPRHGASHEHFAREYLQHSPLVADRAFHFVAGRRAQVDAVGLCCRLPLSPGRRNGPDRLWLGTKQSRMNGKSRYYPTA